VLKFIDGTSLSHSVAATSEKCWWNGFSRPADKQRLNIFAIKPKLQFFSSKPNHHEQKTKGLKP